MAYPDLPQGLTFWRCRNCGNETLFRAAGTGSIQCCRCGQVWSLAQLTDAHARAHPETSTASTAAPTAH